MLLYEVIIGILFYPLLNEGLLNPSLWTKKEGIKKKKMKWHFDASLLT